MALSAWVSVPDSSPIFSSVRRDAGASNLLGSPLGLKGYSEFTGRHLHLDDLGSLNTVSGGFVCGNFDGSYRKIGTFGLVEKQEQRPIRLGVAASRYAV
jgi:hypothetical protein